MAPLRHTLRIDPDPTKPGHEVLLLDAAPEQAGARGPVLIRAKYCIDPRCQCSEVRFRVMKLDDQVERVVEDQGELELVLKSGRSVRPPFEFESTQRWLDLITGTSGTLHTDGDEDDGTWEGADAEHTAAFEPLFDGELLDELWRRQARARHLEVEPLTRKLPDDYTSERMLAWEDVCPDARPDLYLSEDDQIDVAEQYCPAPDCDCKEGVVVFVSNTHGHLGAARVQFEARGAEVEATSVRHEPRLRAAWAAYVERWPDYRERLRARYDALRAAVGDAVLEHARGSQPYRREGPKVGRNQPCPCGSGRKYKRCCGG